jgi:hypothetical protein
MANHKPLTPTTCNGVEMITVELDYISKLRAENKSWRLKLIKALKEIRDLRAELGLPADEAAQ